MSCSYLTESIENLAAEIGKNVYMDIAKWHLYLNDAHLHTPLAERLYPLLVEDDLEENKVLEILQEITVKLGGGRRQIPLLDLMPMQAQLNLMDLLEEFQSNL
ncbi:MAG: DUF3181 family protein [Roseofilum sp. SBFL]|uniref:DUF3181 family protein n=1 Tax=unclassified Roseofilum TaxID=2620099 RepID=UPI001B16D978|nr:MULTISPECIES: DUF3181 family protein [unclassified Roseofilum]MBP0012833.1 DUF3181 family protein [Roseofilum sp. SID3]MBP0025309.1 DUF3181 family protein [Roseofilum sp. SID2]MBP0036962.1 DUF3181 family protein [Roseofilum sp. SID1]MBP0042037.1 DUF3181 family protein [Roseofilum sp. SBFL]